MSWQEFSLFLVSMKIPGILSISFLLVLFSCRKESFINSPDARLTITADTLKYDTVFVTSGSFYQYFRIINENNQKLRITSVKLMGGAGSAYKINVDGTPGPELTNLELEPNDSLYVFVQININQNANTLPFIVRDSIQVTYNGNVRKVQLEAWGQNAHFFRNKEISVNETWNNDLPYVILGSLIIDPNKTLTINKGCRVYVHGDAPIIVAGSMQVNGLKDSVDRVYFRGDRLDEPYNNYPGAWPGIYFSSTSKDNVFNYADIRNSYQSIAAQDPSPNANPKIILNECVIDNSYDAGIIAINSSISARNCLVSNCGKNIFLVKGGNYQFNYCTVASYSNNFIPHKDPVLLASNYVTINNVQTSMPLTALFQNCIFWGEGGLIDDEVIVTKNTTATLNVTFNNALWKVKNSPANIPGVIATQILNGTPPLFDSISTSKNYYDFRLRALPVPSPAINKGAVIAGIITDLDGKSRQLGVAPDLGCFEKQ